jgi:hypothetical protein
MVNKSEGPILEVGPGINPVVPQSSPGAILCDIDTDANSFNSFKGYKSCTPYGLRDLIQDEFQLIIACFVLHFPVGSELGKSLVDCLDPDGIFAFNVVSKSVATRTHAMEHFSRLGLNFQCFDLGHAYGKSDVMFIGSKCDFSSPYQKKIRDLLMADFKEASH